MSASDEQLFRQAARGNEAAFAAIYGRHQPGVYRFALQMSGSEAIAEEVTQDVFLEILRQPDRFDPSRGALAQFVYGIARNRVLQTLVREGRYVGAISGESEEGAVEQVEPAPSALDELTRAERVETLRQAILTLPAAYREALVLCSLHEMTYEEAAAVLNCPVGTVRSRLARAKALLEERFRAQMRCSA